VNEGGEDDPFALMTVLNLNFHSEKPWCTQLKAYLMGRLESQPLIKEKLQSILELSTIDVGWLINERLINMPPQIVTPMLRMLLEELTWAEEDV
jgi:protein BCP1